jgi:hypothetical protein
VFRITANEEHAGNEELRCSFCGNAEFEIRKLIAGPKVYICDECVRICLLIVEDDRSAAEMREQDTPSVGSLPVSCSLCGMLTAPDSVLLVENKGVLCSLCVRDVQSAIAERDEQHPQS